MVISEIHVSREILGRKLRKYKRRDIIYIYTHANSRSRHALHYVYRETLSPPPRSFSIFSFSEQTGQLKLHFRKDEMGKDT